MSWDELIMSIAYWMKNENVALNFNASYHEDVMLKLVELMDAGGNLSDVDNYEEIFFDEQSRVYKTSFKESKPLESGLRSLAPTTTLRFVDGVVIMAVTCDGVKMPGISAITIPNGIYYPSKNMANNPARIFFLVVYPNDGSCGDIKLAAELEEMLNDADFKAALINSNSAEDFIKLISDKEGGNFSPQRDIKIISPLNGTLIPLNEVDDPVFGGGAMGRGAAVKNPDGKVYAPFDGEITVFFPTHHAIGLKSNDGIELLIHVGMDTVKLNGECFSPKAEAGDKVKRGQLLLEFDTKGITKAGYQTTTPVVVTNHKNFGEIIFENNNFSVENNSDEERVAKLIMQYVGGVDNVRTAEYCSTRLKITVNDKSKIQEKKIENIEGVKGQFFAAQQYQIICGTGFVDKVAEEFIRLKKILRSNNNSNVKRRGSSMAITLKKGQKVDLTKGTNLTKILVGLGWKEKRYDGGYDFDLDAAAFLLGANGKVNSDDDFVFYNNLKHVSGSVEHMGDELTGGGDEDEGDQEQIKIDLAKIPANVDKIDFTVTIYEADERKQTFGQVEAAYIRVVDDATGKELIRYDLGEDFSIETAVVVGEIYRNKGEWKFNAIGSGFSGGLAALGRNFGVNV